MKINNCTYNRIAFPHNKISFNKDIAFCSVGKNLSKDTFVSSKKDKIKNLDFDSLTGKLVEQDALMIKKAHENNIPEEDVFVREYDDVNKGLEQTATGDIFGIKDEKNIFLKLPKNEYMQLGIDKKTYMKLFPPILRYMSNQRNSGDCYLISVINQMIVNPNSRKYIYGCFENDEEGNITVKLPNSKTSVTIKPDETIHDLGVISNRCANGAFGIQLLEYIYKKDVLDEKVNYLKSLTRGDTEFVKGFWKNNKEFFTANGVEQDDFDGIEKAVSEKISNITDEIKSKYRLDLSFDTLYAIFSIFRFDKWENGKLSHLGVEKMCLILNDYDYNFVSKFASQLHHDYQPYEDIINGKDIVFSSISAIRENKKEVDDIISDTQYFEKIGGEGGCSVDVFKKFGIKSAKSISLSSRFPNHVLNVLLENPAEQENYIITAGSRNKESILERIHIPTRIVTNHSYGFEIIKDKKGNPLIKVTNPWDTRLSNKQKIKELTPKEFVKYFDRLYIADLGSDPLFLLL